jgi:hypothetical protein
LEDANRQDINDIEFNLKVLGDMALLKLVFQDKVSTKMMTQVIKIALNLRESKIASCIVADYKANLNESMIERALKTDQMDFIYTVWSHHENFSADSNKTMTFEYLFDKILEICPETCKAKVNQVVYWMIDTEENILLALLINNADFAATKYIHLYFRNVTMDLLLF